MGMSEAISIEESLMYQWNINTRSIYHLLCRAFGQCVAISQIVDFNISNVVAVRNIHLTVHQSCAVA